MSILCDISAIALDVASLFMPRSCLACGRVLLEGEESVCLACRYNIPLTNYAKNKENPVKLLFDNVLPVESAMAMFWFVGGTEWQRIIHNFKYHGRWYFAQKMGEWLGEELIDSDNFEDIDLIIPIPLHFRRRLRRGYNQSEQLAIGVARKMGVAYDFRAVRRHLYNESQTLKSRTERWDNVEEIFEVRNAKRLRGHHILLVDDVLTTGATMSSCASTIVKACEGDVRISIATLSVSRRIMEER
jgi:ComF family protein